MDHIKIRGARTHNLKNINLDIPRNKLVVITGISGSGKSSLAFDTLYAEGQRRYVESLSAYARQFLSMMEKPDVDHIEGLSPAISIEQKSTSHNPRSTVGTITEIYDYLRLLFARVGEPRCPEHGVSLAAQTVTQIVDQIMQFEAESKWMILAPVIRNRKGEHLQIIEQLRSQGFVRARVDGTVMELDEIPTLDKNRKHHIEAVIDRIKVRDGIQTRLAESIETCIELAEGIAIVASMDGQTEHLFSARYACPHCGYSVPELEPRNFSFNNPAGACEACDGLGVKQFFDPDKIVEQPDLTIAEGAIRGWDRRSVYYFQMAKSVATHFKVDLDKPYASLPDKFRSKLLYGTDNEPVQFTYVNAKGDSVFREHPFEGIIPNLERRYRETESASARDDLSKFLKQTHCPECSGSRLKKTSRHVFINQYSLPQISRMGIAEALALFETLKLEGHRQSIAEKITKEIGLRLQFLVNVGLDYLTLDRSAETLSGGEAQRIRLASQIGAGLVGVMYVLDEPSIGLHQRDNDRLLATLNHLRDLGNSVIVVEHDEDAILSADYVVDIGPAAGIHGGEVIASGTPTEIMQNPLSSTGQYLCKTRQITIPSKRIPRTPGKNLSVLGARGNNLKNVQLEIPVGLFTCITGVSGSGKSTLINQTLYPVAASKLNQATTLTWETHDAIEGLHFFDKVIDINQSPIGRTPRSNPATYTGIFTPHTRVVCSNTRGAISRLLPRPI
jgi:excinuclease ABC subunit A